ncbi:alginate O-acetyltransferase AlgX-related protein [Deinococcus sp.]|uniref:alginate O-acetyltransferase AlgX-related protein n=1 Tax=Deinococcus sp. TaxID=47478 RepID=UPI003C7D9552
MKLLHIGFTVCLSTSGFSIAQSSIDAYPDYFLGKNGWVVSKQDYTEIVRFRDVKSDWPQAHFDFMSKVVKSLEGKGIKVIIAVIPQRLNVYPQMLPKDLYLSFTKDKTSYENLMPEIRLRGMHTADLLNAITRSPYYSSDAATYFRFEAHWNFYGAYAGAGEVYRQIKQTFGDLKLPMKKYELKILEPVPRKDTYWLSNLPKDVQPTVHPDYDVPYTLTLTSDQSALLGDDIPAVTIVGTSFTGYGFRQSLMYYLKADILDASLPGKGMWTPMAQYIKSDAYNKTHPKLIVWEMPEYILENYPMPTDDEYKIFSSILGISK